MNKSSVSEKIRTRDVKYYAVAQWLRNMPETADSDVGRERRNAESDTENFTNCAINVQQASETDQPLGEEHMCNESSLNACSIKPMRLHGSKCRINEPNEKPRILDATKASRRVKFDIKSNADDADDKADDTEKRVKYDVIIRTAEEDNAELKRSMTKYLAESAARKDPRKQNSPGKSSKYVINPEDVDCHVDSGPNKPATSAADSGSRSRKSSYSVKEFDDVIFNRNALLTAPPTHLPQRIPSDHQSTRSAWSPGMKRLAPKTVHLKYRSGTKEIQAPVIKGLVVDIVENQKPSVIRASRNANIREEFALKQKVEGYRASCNQSINKINFAQRKFSSNLRHLRNRMASRVQADDKHADSIFYVKTQSEELFMQSKGYFPETRPGSRSYNFPPLTYPKRRVLTVS